jgi:glucosamine--fructose-6-phosphate aminotransferase (isomerizing)
LLFWQSREDLNDFTKGLSATRYQSIVLTGMGNSFHILTPLYLKLIELGFSVLLAETSELIHFMPRLLGNRTVLIVVSQSGRSGEIVRLLSMKGEGATILGVTNDPASPLAMESDVVALIQAGPEASVACKTTTASLAALAWIGEYMATTDVSSTKDRLEPIAPAVERYPRLLEKSREYDQCGAAGYPPFLCDWSRPLPRSQWGRWLTHEGSGTFSLRRT